MPERQAVVVGAGIGGLTAAIALHRRGWHVTVCERAPELPITGAGIGLAPNALRALGTIGIDAAHAVGSAVPATMGLRRSDGRWLTRTDTADMAARYGVPPIAVPRSALTAALAAALPPEAIRYGTAVTAVDDAAGRPTVRTADGPDLSADLVVAADGIHSPLRRVYFPAHPGLHYIGETAWRTIVDAPDLRIPAMSETWGRGERFGVTPLSDGRYYLYATAIVPVGTRSADPRAELRRRFGSIAWVGDAAHAMAPNLGQGGCQAIEDAVVLAHLLPAGDGDDGSDSVPAALVAYTAARRDRTDALRVRARRAGRLGSLRNPLVAAARDLAIRATPARLALRGMDDLFNGFRLPG
ncbi:FAD-dependent monooxygenase [Kitasatospora sp. Root107]|uniref:FAD-dependent monooxygenase n=1 Tax=Kitasatospora sp. Root107 TaxID=1736424 RepID=UPI00070E124B|nr:FAD-dependent monooxygenase [Kitasatospora sp. Root107]KQV17145.1 monooxygenase [Kitasatospora sp. Root107]